MMINVIFDEIYDAVVNYSYDGYILAIQTFILTIILDICSYQTIYDLCCKQKSGTRLYVSAIVLNIINHFCIGGPIYGIASKFLCSSNNNHNIDNEKIFDNISVTTIDNVGNILQHILSVVAVMLLHAIQYYAIHKYFHESPKLYRIVHQYHHQFKLYVPPMAANAVTPTEYLIAYAIPFATACIILPNVAKTTIVLKHAIMYISITNLFVHTPLLQNISTKYVIPNNFLFVSTDDHLTHHSKVTTKYASPTFNIDNIIQRWFKQPQQQEQERHSSNGQGRGGHKNKKND